MVDSSLVFDPTPPERVLVVVAHPDDIDFGAAGTLARWADGGSVVAYAIATSGQAGGDDLSVSSEDIAAIREAEQRAAAAIVGATDVRFLGFEDGMLEPTLALRTAIAREIRRARPDLVLTQSPERDYGRIYASHPDHLAVGEATVHAVYPDARNPRFPGLPVDPDLPPWSVPAVWLMGGSAAPGAGTAVVDITDTVDRKIAALRAHTSQTSHRDDLADMVRSWAAQNAEHHGLVDGRLAEVFRSVVTA